MQNEVTDEEPEDEPVTQNGFNHDEFIRQSEITIKKITNEDNKQSV